MLRNLAATIIINLLVSLPAFSSTTITGKGSTFILTYDNLYTSEYQEVMNAATQFWADMVKSSVPIRVHVGYVNKACINTYNMHVSTAVPAAFKNFANAPLADTYYPVALANSYAGKDLAPDDVDITIRFNRRMVKFITCESWYLGYDANYTTSQYSLYFETMQEIAHGLGFQPLGDLFNAAPLDGTPDVLWRHLRSGATGKYLTELSGDEAVKLARDNTYLVFSGPKALAASAHFESQLTDYGPVLFTRSYALKYAIGMHVHHNTEPLQLMDINLRGAIPETDFTVAVLEDLGWKTTRNTAPVINSQKNLEIAEETALNISTSQFSITDESPDSLTVIVGSGANYQVAGTVITPAKDFTGTLTVPVKVNDGEYDSNTFHTKISVKPVNVRFTAKGKTATPEKNVNGSPLVAVSVDDDQTTRVPAIMTVNVNAVNDPPVITDLPARSIMEDNSFTVTQDLLAVADPDDETFSINIARGAHYQVAGNTIIPDDNWNGVLQVPVTVSDGEATSESKLLTLAVSAVNDLPVLESVSLPQGQIYRNYSVQLSATDIEGSALTYSLGDAPEWLTITEQGLLTAQPNKEAIGQHALEIKLSDGTATVAHQLSLSIIDDPTTADISINTELDSTIWQTDTWVPVLVHLTNLGPAESTDVTLTVDYNGIWLLIGDDCVIEAHQCTLNVTEKKTLVLLVNYPEQKTLDLDLAVHHAGVDFNAANNHARSTITFVENFEKVNRGRTVSIAENKIRAIAVADIQGNQSPELFFATASGQSSTAYRLTESLSDSALHSQLNDLSNSYDLAVVDVDADGDLDWVLANGTGEANTVYANNGDGTFALIGTLGAADSRSVAVGDFDIDGDVDLVFANGEAEHHLYLNNGSGHFTLARRFQTCGSFKVLAADVNLDQRTDLILMSHQHPHALLLNTGFSGSANSTLINLCDGQRLSGFTRVDFGRSGDVTLDMQLADLNADGTPTELIVVTERTLSTPATIQIFSIEQSGKISLLSKTEQASIAGLATGDYNNDGKDEIAILRPGGAINILYYDGEQLIDMATVDTDGATAIFMADIDDDGKADIVSASNKNNASHVSLTEVGYSQIRVR